MGRLVGWLVDVSSQAPDKGARDEIIIDHLPPGTHAYTHTYTPSSPALSKHQHTHASTHLFVVHRAVVRDAPDMVQTLDGGGAHPGEAQQRGHEDDAAQHQQVQVVGRRLLHPVVRVVHHADAVVWCLDWSEV